MKAVIDEDLHRSLKQVLERLGFEAFDIRDEGLRGQPDSKIFSYSQKNKAVLFTADLGFSSLINFPPGTHCGVVVLRFPNELSTETINRQTLALLSKVKPDEYLGNIIIVTPSQVRIRRAS